MIARPRGGQFPHRLAFLLEGDRTHVPGMSTTRTPTPMASNDDIARFLGVGDDTRRAILRACGLPKRRSHAWSELWARFGLAPEQPEEIWKYLMLCVDRRNTLWDVGRVADEIGAVRATVNDWCARGTYPAGFPPPLIDHRRKTRLWLPLEVRAYMDPSIYGDLARKIRRRSKDAERPAPPTTIDWHGTLQPLPKPYADETK